MGLPKQTLRLGRGPMLARVLQVLRQSKVDRIIVVLGAGASGVKRRVEFGKEEVVINRRFREGMSESIRVGMAKAEEADAVLIVLGDQPFVTSATVDRLIGEYHASKAPVVVPVHHGVRGNPVLFDKSLFPKIKQISGDVGAKSVVAGIGERLASVVVEDEGILVDVDTPSDYSKALSRKGPVRTKRSRERA